MLQSFLQCPKHFYDVYILNKLEESSSNLEFGTCMHTGIRTILEGGNGIEKFNSEWEVRKLINLKYYSTTWEEYRDLGEHFLKNFKIRHVNKFTEFQQELKMEMPLGENTIQGTADYIGKYEGVLTVCDWKTSSKEYRKNKIHYNLQLYIYAKLYQHNTGVLPEQVMYKVFNKSTGHINTIKKVLTQEILDARFKEVQDLSSAMLQFINNRYSYHGADCYCLEET